MIGTIFYFGISSLLYMSCAAALLVQHVSNERAMQLVDYSMLNETSSNETHNGTADMDDDVMWESMERNRLKAILSTVALSASCVNETEYLIDNVDAIIQRVEFSRCSLGNQTLKTCEIKTLPDTFVDEATCISSGGQFYDNYSEPNFYKCFNYNDGYTRITDIGLLYYPICVGASCNASEVESALDGLILADLDDGSLGSLIDFICASKPAPAPALPAPAPVLPAPALVLPAPVPVPVLVLSSSQNVFDSCGVICLTVTMFASVIYAF